MAEASQVCLGNAFRQLVPSQRRSCRPNLTGLELTDRISIRIRSSGIRNTYSTSAQLAVPTEAPRCEAVLLRVGEAGRTMIV